MEEELQLVTQALDVLNENFPHEGMCRMANEVERTIANHLPPVECELDHLFTPGLYSRTCLVPRGTLLTSKIHKSTHPFVVLTGMCGVWTIETGWKIIKAPYAGVTTPGTYRIIYAFEETRWMTFHPTEETDLKKIEELLIEPHEVPTPCLESNNNLPSA